MQMQRKLMDSAAWRACVVLLLALAAACAPVEAAPSPAASTASSPIVASIPVTAASTGGLDPFLRQRLELVTHGIEALGVSDPDVLRVMRLVPRHAFVPEEYLDQAYANHPLPIGYGQTISQPYIVAWMTDLLELQPGEKVLEIGTGSGYQAAVLAELGYVEVYSIEIVPELAASASTRLKALGYERVITKQGDGYYGWPEHGPFDAIIVTAAPDHVPAPLVAQLAEGGRMVIPIGPPGGWQSLWKFVKEGTDVKAYDLGGVAFVPLTGPGAGAPAPSSTTTP